MIRILLFFDQGDSRRGDGRDPRPPSSFLWTQWDQVDSIKTMKAPISSAEIFGWTTWRWLRLIWTGRSRVTVGSGKKRHVGWSLRKMLRRWAIITFTFTFYFHFLLVNIVNMVKFEEDVEEVGDYYFNFHFHFHFLYLFLTKRFWAFRLREGEMIRLSNKSFLYPPSSDPQIGGYGLEGQQSWCLHTCRRSPCCCSPCSPTAPPWSQRGCSLPGPRTQSASSRICAGPSSLTKRIKSYWIYYWGIKTAFDGSCKKFDENLLTMPDCWPTCAKTVKIHEACSNDSLPSFKWIIRVLRDQDHHRFLNLSS